MPQIIGVRVHTNDGVCHGWSVHPNGLSFSHYDDGCLAILDEKIRIALYAPQEWAWVELVHAEPEPIENIAVGRIPTGPMTTKVTMKEFTPPTPAERITAAEQAYADAHIASVQSATEHARAVQDAQQHLVDLRRELGGAA